MEVHCNNTIIHYINPSLSHFLKEIKQRKTAWNNAPFLRIENDSFKKERLGKEGNPVLTAQNSERKGISESLRGLLGIVICGEL